MGGILYAIGGVSTCGASIGGASENSIAAIFSGLLVSDFGVLFNFSISVGSRYFSRYLFQFNPSDAFF